MVLQNWPGRGPIILKTDRQPRLYLAALDTTTGLATSWAPYPGGPVSALALSGGTVYAGGGFILIGGEWRFYLAALDATTGLATGWNPRADGPVNALSVSDGVLYVGGSFTGFNYDGQLRDHLAAFDTSTNLLTAWDPNVRGSVNALASAGNTVCVGGAFSAVGNVLQNRIALVKRGTVGVDQRPAVSNLVVGPIAPSPALTTCSIPFFLPLQSRVRIVVCDLAGRRVTELADNIFDSGRHVVGWDLRAEGRPVAPGVYMVCLEAAGVRIVRRQVVLR